MRHAATTTIIALALALAAASHAARADDVMIAAGRALAANGVMAERPGCASCHMQNGAGQPDVGIPRLAGLTEQQIVTQLTYFATGARQSPAMAPSARQLSPAQRQQAAAYFASLPIPPQPDPLASPAASRTRGKDLYLNGDQRTGLIACAQCHGTTALGVGEFSPRLAGQSASYVEEQLRAWRKGAVRDPLGAFMRAEAGGMSLEDINAVAAYVASLGHTETQAP